MTIRHLKIFITVADCGKMRKAAELLYISQPSVSQVIQELESHYGVKLFERLSQKIYLTESGKKLLLHARHVVDSFESMDLDMKNFGEHLRLRLGGSVSVGTCLFDALISRTQKEMPGIKIKVFINNTSFIEEMILKSQLDVGIVEGVVKSNDIIRIPIAKDELVMIVGRSDPLYDKKSIALEELVGHSLISREDGSTDRNQYERLLQERNIELEQNWCSTNTEAIKKAVVAGRGVAIISKMLITQEVIEEKVKILNIDNIKVERDIQLIFHKNKFLSQSLQKFLTVCQEKSNEPY